MPVRRPGPVDAELKDRQDYTKRAERGGFLAIAAPPDPSGRRVVADGKGVLGA
jgi:hypothetical protein